MPFTEIRFTFSGCVQGVGFRRTVANRAEKFHIKGMVKNISDGTVALTAQGFEEDVELFLTDIKQYPGGAHIESMRSSSCRPDTLYRDFRIIY